MKKIIRTLIFVLAIASTSNYIEVNAQEIKASTDIVNIPDNNLKVCIN